MRIGLQLFNSRFFRTCHVYLTAILKSLAKIIFMSENLSLSTSIVVYTFSQFLTTVTNFFLLGAYTHTNECLRSVSVVCAASLALNSPCQSLFSKFIMNYQRPLVMRKITLAVQVSRSRKGKPLESVAFMSMSSPILISLLSLFISDICNFLLDIFSIRSSYFSWSDYRKRGR